MDFGIGLKDNKFEFFKDCAHLNKLYTISYALAVATSGKAKKITLAGFDGYGEKDLRTKTVSKIFFDYLNFIKNFCQLILFYRQHIILILLH